MFDEDFNYLFQFLLDSKVNRLLRNFSALVGIEFGGRSLFFLREVFDLLFGSLNESLCLPPSI